MGNPPGGGQPPTYVADIGNAQEVAFTSSGGLGESETAGLVMNIVPKTGGNSVHGAVLFSSDGRRICRPTTVWDRRSQTCYDINGFGGRADPAGPCLVLHQRAQPGKHPHHSRRLLQQQRRQSRRMAL